MNSTTIPIGGMSCDGCVRNLRQALGRLPGVKVEAVTVGSATVQYDPSVTDLDTIRTTITSAGYVPLAS